eukprot:6202476-Pleurochrysis_carterae.AAC.1
MMHTQSCPQADIICRSHEAGVFKSDSQYKHQKYCNKSNRRRYQGSICDELCDSPLLPTISASIIAVLTLDRGWYAQTAANTAVETCAYAIAYTVLARVLPQIGSAKEGLRCRQGGRVQQEWHAARGNSFIACCG